MRTNICSYLTTLSHDTEHAIDGVDCLRVIGESKESFDAIFLDVNMPRLGGIELLDRLGSCDNFCFERTKVVMVTTETSKEILKQAKNKGVYAWMVKPVSKERIIKLVKAIEQHDFHKTIFFSG